MNPDAAARFAAFKKRLEAQKREKAAVAQAKAEVRSTAASLKLRRRFITSERLAELTGELAHDQAQLAKLRDDLQWEKLSVVISGQYQHCTCCGHKAEATAGIYMRERHKTFRSAFRLKYISDVPEGYPIEVHHEGVTLQRCIKCAGPNRVDDLLESCEHPGLQIHSQRSLF